MSKINITSIQICSLWNKTLNEEGQDNNGEGSSGKNLKKNEIVTIGFTSGIKSNTFKMLNG